MSAFDLAGDHDSASLIDQARSNPLDLSQPAGFFTGMGTGLATGVGRLLADTQRTTGLALGAVAGSFDLLTGDAIKAQEKVFEHIVTPADKLSRHLAPKPEEIGMAGQLLHGLVKIGGEAVAFGAPGVLVNETVGGTLDALDKGVALQTAGKVGGVQGAAMTAGVIAPMTLGATGLGMNVLYGAGINLAQGIFQRGATSEIYAKAGRNDLAMQFRAMDGEAMVVDAILGAAFAGGGRYLQLRGEKAKADAVAEYKAKLSELLKPEQIDAALVKNEQIKLERSGMGLPADLASRDAHVANLTGAIDDLIEGRPVAMREPVGDTIPDPAAAKVQAEVEEVLRPAVAFHGTPNVVDVPNLKPSQGGELGAGLYISKEKGFAAQFAETRGEVANAEKAAANAGVIDLDISRLNLKTISKKQFLDDRAVLYDSELALNDGEWNMDVAKRAEEKLIEQYQRDGFDGLYVEAERQGVVFPDRIAKLSSAAPQKVGAGDTATNRSIDAFREMQPLDTFNYERDYQFAFDEARNNAPYDINDLPKSATTNATSADVVGLDRTRAGWTATVHGKELSVSGSYSKKAAPQELANAYNRKHSKLESRFLNEDGELNDEGIAELDRMNDAWADEQAKNEVGSEAQKRIVDFRNPEWAAKYLVWYFTGETPRVVSGSGKSQSKYITVPLNGKEVGVRVADHELPIEYREAGEARGDANELELSLYDVDPSDIRADGRSMSLGIDEAEAINRIHDFIRMVESTPTANKPELSQGLPRDGMQERAVRADKSGSPEPAQSDGAVGGSANVAQKAGGGKADNDPALDPWNEPQAPRTFEQRIADENIRAELLRMKNETGWAEEGGKLLRSDGEEGDVIGRTAWVPNAEWWPGRPKGLKEFEVKVAIDKAIAGEKLKAAERRIVEYMADVAEQRQRSDAWKPTGDELAETGLASHNELDVAMTARAAEIDPDAVESLAIRFETDDAGFMRGIKELLDEHDRQTAASRQEGQRTPDATAGQPDPGTSQQPDALRPDAVIPLDDTDATTTVAEAQGIITDLETAAREQETGLRAAVACFLRAA